jgi:hypothetical protein
MTTSTILVLILLTLCIVAGVLWWWTGGFKLRSSPTAFKPTPGYAGTYHCDESRSLEASFKEKLVDLVLPDNRRYTLQEESVFGESVTYINEKGTVKFVTRGHEGELLEDGVPTYRRCVTNAGE